jgi:eukaryotic-like serine/threonine-protein kinase
MTAAADRHLLFGLLALQNGLIDQGALVAAFQAWTRDKTSSLADQLVARGDLDAGACAGLEAIVALHVKKHGYVEHSLSAVPANHSTRASLAALGEPEIEATLARVARSKNGPAIEVDDDPDRTAALSVGAATSDGQRFRLLRPHARGGLGEVFVALDAELHRKVAHKQILERHADDPISRQRFVAEAEITGGLEHPGVVSVYGLGTYGSGRPYYAMRFIKGDSLKEAIERFHEGGPHPQGEGRHRPGVGPSRDLELRKLLRRFLDVCNAIDYAHSRGVIHRDIKPANIILGKHGETLVVDWGLAKAVGRADPSAGEQTIAPSSSGSSETLPGSALGTPAYMSPEQAGGDLDRLGPRSDVYSLGATLYCLLTGSPPFEGDDIGEILRRVQAGDVRAPREIDPATDKALEAVCLKAMATKPTDRYATCRALAEDIERWAADEPVSAYREPLSRRVRRWASRNRTAVASVAVALFAGVVGLSAVLVVQTQAKAEVTRALTGERDANRALAASNDELARSRAAVQARYDLAVEAIKTFHTGVSEDFLLKQDQFKELRDRLLRSAQDFYGKLSALLGRETDLAARRALAATNFELADPTGKAGSQEDALKAHRAVLAAREALAAEPGASAAVTVEVGRSLIEVAGLLQRTGKTGEALATYRRSESLLTGPAGTDPAARAARASCLKGLGQLLWITGQAADALAAFRQARADQEALAVAPGAPAEARRDLADTINHIGARLDQTGKHAEAEAEHRRGLEILEKLAADNPAVTGFRSRLANSHGNLALLLLRTGRPAESEAESRRGLAIYQKLAADNPAVTDFRFFLAMSHNNLGNLLSETGKLSEAEAEYRRGLEIYQKLAADNPTVPRIRLELAGSHINLGLVLDRTGKLSEAEAEFRRMLEIGQKLAAGNPNVPLYRFLVAMCREESSSVLRHLGRPAEARDACEQAIAITEALVQQEPKETEYRRRLALSYRRRGLARGDLRDVAGAAADARRAMALLEGMSSRTGEAWFDTACARAALASLAGRAGSGVSAAEADAAMTLFRKAIEMGYSTVTIYRAEDVLDSLRSRDDFRLLLMDLAMPAEPFAPETDAHL